jgi:aarF domain-containing kinase
MCVCTYGCLCGVLCANLPPRLPRHRYLTYQYKVVWTPENAPEVNARVARRLVDTCKRNEGLYVKFGQALASMAFALPREYIEPLSELHDKAMTFPLEEVKKIVKAEVGDVLLTDFEDTPVASASLAQVHRARLNGKLVAVKIQKPNVAVQAEWDLRMYHVLLTVLEFFFDMPLDWTYEYTKSQLLGEVDFRSEAEHSNRAAAEFQQSALRDCIYVPEIYACSKRVIISEWIDSAMKITDREQIAAAGLDSHQVVSDAVSAFAFQIFHVGHVHCDPHPGNLLVRLKPGGKPGQHEVVVIDHGLYVELPEELRLDYANFWVAMTPPKNSQVLQEICTKWGIKDFELYAKITAFNKQGDRSAEDMVMQEANSRSNAELQSLMKEQIKKALNDTSLFPRPLLFVGRCQNYIRATNWAHGNPIDRFAVMMQYANGALAANVEPQTVWEQLRGAYVSSAMYITRTFMWMFPSSFDFSFAFSTTSASAVPVPGAAAEGRETH